jgi:hypothetical protein
MKTTKVDRDLMRVLTEKDISWHGTDIEPRVRPLGLLDLLDDLDTLEKQNEFMRKALECFSESAVDDGCGGYLWRDQSIADAMLVVRECLATVDRINKGEG